MDSEIQLISRLQNSNTKSLAFNQLVELYKERLYWHIRHIVKSHDDADDVLQNTFIKVFKNITNFKGHHKNISFISRRLHIFYSPTEITSKALIGCRAL